MMDNTDQSSPAKSSFFDRPGVLVENIPVGEGVPLGIEAVSNSRIGIGGAYGTWGRGFDNQDLPGLIESRWGQPLPDGERLNLSELGFLERHHVPQMSGAEHLKLEVEIGARFLRAATQACGWQPSDVDAVLIGMSGPVSDDYTERIAREAGIPDQAIKVSIHKACDSSVAGLNMALNPDLPIHSMLQGNLAQQLLGKKVLVGGIEGLSRFMMQTHDSNAIQLFGNGAGVIGVIPGMSMRFLAGSSHEAYDEDGVLQVRMFYPHSRLHSPDHPLTEVFQDTPNVIRIAGLMHEPLVDDPVVMAGPMGMVKLFVRTGVQTVREAYEAYRRRLEELNMPGKDLAVAIVHHANYKINQLKEKHLQREGIHIPMPWLIKEFGNVSAASNMIAFLRQLPFLNPGDHILIDGFGAGTYYDVLAVELGG
jgi:3-oxoacyl-[acyl-carrier-protein] synthase III